ncbi:MAG TPA: hypothetical protein VIV59_02705 [Anaeromyxobacteraceae bacterium]
MFQLMHESGYGAWLSLILALAGLAATFTLGRRSGRAGSVAAAFAAAVLASGQLGVGSGQRKVDGAVQATPASDLATRVEILSVGTREASANLLFSGACALLVLTVGGALALGQARRSA